MPRLPVTLAAARTPRWSSAVRYRRVRTRTSSKSDDVPGSTSIIAHVGWWLSRNDDVHGFSSTAPKLAAHARAAGESRTRYCSVSPGSASSLRQRGIHAGAWSRSEEHTSELQSLMRISYAVFCLKKKQKPHRTQ